MLFKVQVKEEHLGNYASAFTIMRFTKELATVNKFSGKFCEDQESDFLSQLHRQDVLNEKVDSSDNEVTTPIKVNEKMGTSQEVSGSVKRELLGEFSTNASSSKRKRVMVKQEKQDSEI